MPRKTPRLNSLTSLRYFAAAAVVVTHVNPFFLTSALQREATAYWYVGVSFFFMLLGFVLTWSCSWQPARPFWWNRFSRIWPLPATMMIIVYAGLWDFVSHPPNAVGWILEPFVVQGWDPDPHVYAGGNGPTWSLSCEFFFYAMFPLLVRLVRQARAAGPGDLGRGGAGGHGRGARPRRPARLGLDVPVAVLLPARLPDRRVHHRDAGGPRGPARAAFPRPSPGYLLGWAWVAAWVVFTTLYTRTHHGDPVARPFATMLVLPGFVLLVLVGARPSLTGRTRLMGAWLPVKLASGRSLSTWSRSRSSRRSPPISR